jgi:hypothetical protein
MYPQQQQQQQHYHHQQQQQQQEQHVHYGPKPNFAPPPHRTHTPILPSHQHVPQPAYPFPQKDVPLAPPPAYPYAYMGGQGPQGKPVQDAAGQYRCAERASSWLGKGMQPIPVCCRPCFSPNFLILTIFLCLSRDKSSGTACTTSSW